MLSVNVHTSLLLFPLLNLAAVLRGPEGTTLRLPRSSLGNVAYATLSLIFMVAKICGGIFCGGGAMIEADKNFGVHDESKRES